MSYRILSAILKQPWAIDPRFAESCLPAINNVLNGITAFEKNDITPVSYVHYEEHGAYSISTESIDESGSSKVKGIAVLNIAGPVMKYDQDCGPMGMLTMSDIFKRNDRNPNIHGHILILDTPGGTVAGTSELGDTIKSASKPVIALVSDEMCSAGVWIGSNAKEVYASKELDEIGSIGVMMHFADTQPMWERQGVKFHMILADQSKDKNKTFKDLQNGNYDDYKKNVLNPLAEEFIKVVKQNRPNVKDEQLTGKVFFARDLVGSLIDGIKTFDQVVQRAIELANENENASKKTALSSKTIQNSSMGKTFLNLNKTVGAELETADGGIFLTEEQATAVDAALVETEPDTTALTTAQSERDAAIAERDQASQTITDRDARITELEAEVTRLQGAAGASTATTVIKTEVTNEQSEEFTMEMSMEERVSKILKNQNSNK